MIYHIYDAICKLLELHHCGMWRDYDIELKNMLLSCVVWFMSHITSHFTSTLMHDIPSSLSYEEWLTGWTPCLLRRKSKLLKYNKNAHFVESVLAEGSLLQVLAGLTYCSSKINIEGLINNNIIYKYIFMKTYNNFNNTHATLWDMCT